MTNLASPPPVAPVHGPTEPDQPSTGARFSPRPVHRLGLGAAVTAVVWAIVLPGAPVRSLGTAIALGAIVIALAAVARLRTQSTVLVAGAAALLPWLAVRDSPWVAAVNLALSGALVLTAISDDGTGRVLPGPRRFVRRCSHSIAASRFGPVIAHRAAVDYLDASPVKRGTAVSALKHSVIAIAVTLVGAGLLASGDALFASFLSVDSALSSVTVRAIIGAFGGVALVFAVGAARARPTPVRSARDLSNAMATTVIISLAVVIAAYGIVQVVAVASGAAYVEGRTGLTYAEWARSGFFQVSGIVAVAVAALLTARSATQTAHSRRLFASASVLTIGTLGLVATAIAKLAVYTDQFGLTMLRLYTITFAIWLGGLSIATLAALARPTASWLRSTVVSSLVVGALAMSAANPEQIVAEHNIERAAAGADFDFRYVNRLSADATPSVLAYLAANDSVNHTELVVWCRRLDSARPFFSTNLSVQAARKALVDVCEP